MRQDCRPSATTCVSAGRKRAFVGLAVDINLVLVIRTHRVSVGKGAFGEAWTMESNERYYRRRAVEERMAAQRAMTEQARAWHTKLAADFAERAQINAIPVSA